MEKDLERLQKFLAQCGIDSRRKCEELILEGKVSVNGEVVTELGTKVNIKYDKVVYDGKELKPNQRHIYIMLNKPEGYITTSKEQFDRPYVMELLEGIDKRVFPVGRLDMDTSGLLLLTDDGEFAYKLTHPKHDIAKTYTAEVKGRPDSLAMSEFSRGIKIEDYVTAPAHIRLMKERKNSSIMEITIFEGKNRQIRKMFEAIGHPIISLQRIAVGELFLRNLEEGKYQILKKNELNKVFINKYRKDSRNESSSRNPRVKKSRSNYSQDNNEENKRSYGQNDNKEYKRSYGQNDNRENKRSYGQNDNRENKRSYGQNDNKEYKRSYGQNDNRENKRSYGQNDNRENKRSFGQNDNRENKRSYGQNDNRENKRSYGQNDNRENKRSYGQNDNRENKRSYGQNDNRENKRSYGQNDNNKENKGSFEQRNNNKGYKKDFGKTSRRDNLNGRTKKTYRKDD